ncbi:C40 family peptidase [Streptomyces capparidis]
MASHRRPKQAGKARVTVLTTAAAAAVVLSGQAANAAPAKPSKSEVKEQVDKLYHDAEIATEKYNGAKEKQDKLQQQVDDLQDKVAREQSELNDLQSDLGTLASSQYRNGGMDPSVQLFLSSDPDSYLDQASALDQVGTRQAESIKEIQEQKRVLDQEREEAANKLEDLEETRKQLAKNKKDVQAKLKKAQDLLNTLTAEERAKVTAPQQDSGGERASRDSGSREDLVTGVPASQRASAALAAAKTKIGSPYVWGGSGPNSFDCSGLTSWAYAQAGVTIPRTSQAQANAGTRIPLSQAQPGDLIIQYSDFHHVGLYVGNGMQLHAPKPGANVRYETLSYMEPQFAVRI